MPVARRSCSLHRYRYRVPPIAMDRSGPPFLLESTRVSHHGAGTRVPHGDSIHIRYRLIRVSPIPYSRQGDLVSADGCDLEILAVTASTQPAPFQAKPNRAPKLQHCSPRSPLRRFQRCHDNAKRTHRGQWMPITPWIDQDRETSRHLPSHQVSSGPSRGWDSHHREP